MPVITRSITTGPTKMTVTGVKRKFIEILDSDDESSTDSEFEPDVEDEVEDEVEDDLKETEDALINIVIKEREKVQSLEQELEDTKQKYESLLKDVKEIQTICWTEFVCFAGMLVLTSGFALASAYSCNIHEDILFNV